MVYKMQIKVFNKKLNKDEWVYIQSSEGRIYEYPTYEEAFNMLRICYPEEMRFNNEEITRVIKE